MGAKAKRKNGNVKGSKEWKKIKSSRTWRRNYRNNVINRIFSLLHWFFTHIAILRCSILWIIKESFILMQYDWISFVFASAAIAQKLRKRIFIQICTHIDIFYIHRLCIIYRLKITWYNIYTGRYVDNLQTRWSRQFFFSCAIFLWLIISLNCPNIRFSLFCRSSLLNIAKARFSSAE